MAISNADIQSLSVTESREIPSVNLVSKATHTAGVISSGSRQSTYDRETVSKKDLLEAVGLANATLASRGQKLDIGVDNETGTIVVRVSDEKTGEVIRQLPSEEALRITRNIDRLTGILVDLKE